MIKIKASVYNMEKSVELVLSNVRFQEPELFVQVAHDVGQEVRCSEVLGIRHFFNALARMLSRRGVVIRQFFDPIKQPAFGGRLFLFFQLRMPHAFAQRTFDQATERGSALRSNVYVLHRRRRKFIQQFVQSDKSGSAHVPMRLFDARKQIEQIGHGVIQYCHRFFTDIAGEGIASFVHV